MSCAACSARVEKAVRAVPGVEECAVSLLTNSMGVEGTATDKEIIKAVKKAGYGASVKGKDEGARGVSCDEDTLADRETPVIKRRLIASVALLIPLMYVSMGHMMFGLPLPAFFDGNHVAMGLLQLLLSAMILVINQKFFVSGFRSLFHLSPNMDTLVALGSSVSFAWSTYVLFAMTRATADGDAEAVMRYMMDFYFESAAMIVTLITVGKMLEARSKGKTTDALRGLMKLAPKTAVVIRDGKETVLPADKVKKGDIFAVKPGESIPVDGIVIEGQSAVNEAALTGESIPVDKAVGDAVSAAAINQSGYLRCEAVRVGEDTTLSKIIKTVSDAAATKAPIAKIADKVSGIFVPIVISVSAVTAIIWLILGKDIGYALARGIAVLVISCPCALGLATPVAIMVGSGVGARNGVLFKTASSLEEAGKTDIVALDKTGTITKGEPSVTDIIPCEGFDEEKLLSLAASLEKKSEHPLSKAIMKEAEDKSLEISEVSGFSALPGNGLSALIGKKALIGGSVKYISENAHVPDNAKVTAQELAENGKTPLMFALDGELIGIIAVADVIKEDSPRAISELKSMGIRVVMLTGDNQRTAKAIGRAAGVDEVISEVLPEGKAQVIRELSAKGKAAMVGDGINDAPALTMADTGIAIGAGTDVAIDSADIVLMKSRLTDVPAAIRLSRAVLTNIRENLFWAFIYNIIGIPLAAGLFIPIFGWELNPMFAAAAMSLSSFCVVSNALRLNLFKMFDPKWDSRRAKRKSLPYSASTVGRKVLEIDGMMCGHCEERVKKALESVSGVTSASADYESGKATVETSGKVSEKDLIKAVAKENYKVKSVKDEQRREV